MGDAVADGVGCGVGDNVGRRPAGDAVESGVGTVSVYASFNEETPSMTMTMTMTHPNEVSTKCNLALRARMVRP